MHPSASYDSTAKHAAALADGARRIMQVARALVEAEREIELDGLKDVVGLVCARALDLPPEHGAAIRVSLLELRFEADALREALAARAPAPL